MTHTQVNFSSSPWPEIRGRVGKSCKSDISHGKGEGHVVYAGVKYVCGSAHAVVNGSFTRAAF